jgi:hypothetical protein
MAGFFKPKSDRRDGREILLRVPIGHHHQMPVFDAAFGDEVIGNQSGNLSREYPADFGGLIDDAVMPPRRERRGFLDRDQAPRTRGVQC